MKIINKVITAINYEENTIKAKENIDHLNGFIENIVIELYARKNIRNFKANKEKSAVLNYAIKIGNDHNAENFETETNNIAHKLLDCEIEAQSKVSAMKVKVKKGSLIQALIDEEDGNRYYLMAKIEHGPIIEDENYKSLSGFNQNKKNICKSCLINLSEINSEYNAKIYSDNNAKYWSKDFLEFEEVTNDATNTKKSLYHITKILKSDIKPKSEKDYLDLKLATIVYYRSNSYLDYTKLIEEVFQQYQPININLDDYKKTITKLENINNEFDAQFTPDISILNEKSKITYSLTPYIDLVIKDIAEVEKIETFEENGKSYLKIPVTENNTYKTLKEIGCK